MKKKQISNLNAGHSVHGVLDRHHDSLPEAAQECQDELVELTDKIMENARKQKSKTGLSAQKTQTTNELADAAATLAGALGSYGTKIDDNRLVAACAYTRTSIVAGPDAQVSSRCSDLLDEATPLVSKLGKFKVTAATLTAFQGKIDAFVAVRTSPRDAIKQSAAATKRLPKLFGKLRVLLTKRLDPLIAPLKETNPELWSEYKSARKLVHLPTTEQAAKPTADAAAEKDVKVVPAPESSEDKSKVA